MKIAILGGGSFGTALAIHLSKNNHDIKIWEFFESQAREMQDKRICPLLPDVKIPNEIFISSKMQEIIPSSDLIFIAVISNKVESAIEKAKNFIKNQPIIICSKGFAGEIRLLSEMIEEKIKNNVYCLYGPTHAEELSRGIFSGIVLASKNRDDEERIKIKKAVENENLKVELGDDITGVQVCAALKNALAIFIGIIDGINLGDNTKAYAIIKGLEEIKDIGLRFGAKEETFYGLAGIGDIIVTCLSKHSRNRYLGQEIGKGRKLNEILKEMKMVAEGVDAAKTVPLIEKKFNLKLPILGGLYNILIEEKNPREILKDL